MKIDSIDVCGIEELLPLYEYAIIYEFSRVIVGRVDNISLDRDECMEAYFFGKSGQIHVFQDNDILKAVRMTEESGDGYYVDKKYDIADKFSSEGKVIVVREYLMPDEDGQAFVAYTRLMSIEGGD